MQKKDLKPGEIYGYMATGRSELQPVLFLSADLHTWKNESYPDGTRDVRIRPSHPRSVVGRDNGYVALRVQQASRRSFGTVPEERLSAEEQLRMLKEHSGRVPEIMADLGELSRKDGSFLVAPKLAVILAPGRNFTGPWEDVFAARSAADARSAEFDERGHAWQDARNQRLVQGREALEQITGGRVHSELARYSPSAAHSGEDGVYVRGGSVVLTLEELEAVAAALADRPAAG